MVAMDTITVTTGGSKDLDFESARRLKQAGHTNGGAGDEDVIEGTDVIVLRATVGPDGPTGTVISVAEPYRGKRRPHARTRPGYRHSPSHQNPRQ